MKILKRIYSILLISCIIFALSGCGCEHEFEDATCNKPKTCLLCGATEGEPLGHEFEDAACNKPKTCMRCGATEGEPLGHEFVDGYCIRCGDEDPDYFDADKYGFVNSYGMYTWVEITKFSLGNGEPNATYTEMGHYHHIYNIKDSIVKCYSRYESDTNTDKKNLTEKLDRTYNYTIINNDSISIQGKTWTIFERVHDDNGNLVLKTMYGSSEKWFILEEQIDWNKSPKIEDFENGWNKYTYYLG